MIIMMSTLVEIPNVVIAYVRLMPIFMMFVNPNQVVKKENAIRRLNHDRQNLLQEEDPLNLGVSLTLSAVSAGPIENNDLVWTAIIHGPQGSLFEDGIFKILLVFTEEYPFKPPHVRFISKIFHPNISSDGKIPILFHKEFGQKWSPAMSVKDILQLIRTLLKSPKIHKYKKDMPDRLCPNKRAVDLYLINEYDKSEELKNNVLDCVQNSLRDLSQVQNLEENLCPSCSYRKFLPKNTNK